MKLEEAFVADEGSFLQTTIWSLKRLALKNSEHFLHLKADDCFTIFLKFLSFLIFNSCNFNLFSNPSTVNERFLLIDKSSLLSEFLFSFDSNPPKIY